jgi:hypothetical protein
MMRRFNRFELKYLVTVRQREMLLQEIRERMQVDREGDPSGIYRVSSLYLDTADLAFARSKRDGIKYRRKLRIRVYGDQMRGETPAAMVEIKQRINRTVQKRRVCVPLEQAYALCSGGQLARSADARDAAVAGEVEFLVRSLSLAPTCVISYVRQAFQGGVYEPGLRITFDQQLWCSPPDEGLVDVRRRHHFLPQDMLVLEVKANEAVPLWVARMLAHHSIPLQRYSKYCAGLARLGALATWRHHG